VTQQRRAPPPARNGVGASCVVLPYERPARYALLLDFLAQRFKQVGRDAWRERMQTGDVMAEGGLALGPQTPFFAGQRVYYYRTLNAEAPIPFEATVLWQDDHLLVADKPHFLPVTPSGKYVRETLLVRLKDQLGLPELSPIHRIDRDTAGLVMFSVSATARNAYQSMFRQRQVHKVYHCIAPWDAGLPWPVERNSRIVPAAHFMQQREMEGEPNATTTITPVQVSGALALYQLVPLTGQRHQLRVHMHALGLPIVNDGIYPVLTPEGADYSRPLQLLAQSLAFTDPLTGEHRAFQTTRRLLDWATMMPTGRTD